MPDGAENLASELDRLLNQCAAGELPGPVALMHMIMRAESAEKAGAAIRAALAVTEGSNAFARLEGLHRLFKEHGRGFETVRQVARGLDHHAIPSSPEQAVTAWAAAFDRAAAISPEASVALYSLGDPQLLKAATEEVMERLFEWGVLSPQKTVLEIGCGIGRLVSTLAGKVRFVAGIDVSPGMIAEAERRCAACGNVRLLVASGRDLAVFEPGSFDLVLAVDTFPYIVQAGLDLAEWHVHEAARVLRTDGDLVIVNFSYRGDIGMDRLDLARFAEAAGFAILRDGVRCFTHWDGAAFHLRRKAAGRPAGTLGKRSKVS